MVVQVSRASLFAKPLARASTNLTVTLSLVTLAAEEGTQGEDAHGPTRNREPTTSRSGTALQRAAAREADGAASADRPAPRPAAGARPRRRGTGPAELAAGAGHAQRPTAWV